MAGESREAELKKEEKEEGGVCACRGVRCVVLSLFLSLGLWG